MSNETSRSSKNFQTTFPVLICFDYNENGQLIARHQWKVPSKEENARNRLARCSVRHAALQGLGLPGGQTQKYINDLERSIRQ